MLLNHATIIHLLRFDLIMNFVGISIFLFLIIGLIQAVLISITGKTKTKSSVKLNKSQIVVALIVTPMMVLGLALQVRDFRNDYLDYTNYLKMGKNYLKVKCCKVTDCKMVVLRVRGAMILWRFHNFIHISCEGDNATYVTKTYVRGLRNLERGKVFEFAYLPRTKIIVSTLRELPDKKGY